MDEIELLRKCDVGQIQHYPNGGLFAERASPYQIPELLGWRRVKFYDGEEEERIKYRSPDKEEFDDWLAIARHLVRTHSKLSICQFVFDPKLSTKLIPTPIEPQHLITEDISNGQEHFPIRCINQVNSEKVDPKFVYTANRLPSSSVKIHTKFRSCCDCTDGCLTNENCACRRLTCEDFLNDLVWNDSEKEKCYGYAGRRLPFIMLTGVYECNDNDRCWKNCQNRLVQNGISAKLEVFQTESKGWGVRCLHDLPAHTFVCLYAGEVLTTDESNQQGPKRGAEYQTSMNMVEILEEKIGYEKAMEAYGDQLTSDESNDETEFPSKKCQKVETNQQSNWRSKTEGTKYRNYFKQAAEEFEPFVIDAKQTGNVGRFLNHSCDPNCILISIYVDTHDARLPWMCFFTLKYIPALTELTWDYDYDEGSNPFKTCLCGTKNCRSKESSHSSSSSN